MGQIGNFGRLIIFETSDARILQPKGLKKDVSNRWATHSRIGLKPLKQFLGPEADKVTFTISLDANHGIKPRQTLEAIENYADTGTPASLVIGGKMIMKNLAVITSVSETWDEIWSRGELVRATVELTLEEYL